MGSSDWLPAATLARVHDCVSNQTEYSSSGNSVAKVYQNWQRRGDHPIKSPAHGGHYVTIYANDIAATTPTQEVLPGITVGSTLVTPIFAIAGNGKVSAGPMLIMEKMEQGFNAPGGDWRYTLIAPDGTVIGDNTGAGKETINFCKHCSGIFADSVFASLLKGEPPRAPLKPQEKQIARPMTDPAPALVPAKPALLPPPAEYPISQGPKPRPTILPETLDPNAPIADLAEPTTSKKIKKRPSPNSVPDGEETLLDELKTLKRSTPKS
jgi:hypothetical protein